MVIAASCSPTCEVIVRTISPCQNSTVGTSDCSLTSTGTNPGLGTFSCINRVPTLILGGDEGNFSCILVTLTSITSRPVYYTRSCFTIVYEHQRKYI